MPAANRFLRAGTQCHLLWGSGRGAGPVRLQRVNRSILTGRLAPLRYENHPFSTKEDGTGREGTGLCARPRPLMRERLNNSTRRQDFRPATHSPETLDEFRY